MSEANTGPDPLEDLASKLISVAEASELSGLTPGYIRKLLRRGELKGVKVGQNWVTTAEAVREYTRQERRPGPKPE